ncbi:RNA polymerase sigma factor SigJ [Nocardia sp. NPDC049149]|uniref:RNA polymerase sigma factor SigJ n=1 Tax=Nocardia sp. NPDC049149 TaxID=3364315 RepID=UPI00371D07EE
MVAALLAGLFESHRAHLLSVAYRLTGSVGDAEDAVQESWLRLTGTHQSEIDDMRPWLTAVLSRICLDRMHSIAVRRESYVGQWLPEPVVTGRTPSSTPDAMAAMARTPECRLAAMVMLDRLTPPQRVAFVLHEGLSMSLDDIAGILDVSVDAARQLVAAATEAVAHTPPPVSDTEHEVAVQRFLAALRSGEVDAVTAALHPDSVVIGDADGTTTHNLRGADAIADFYLGLVRRYGAHDPATVPAYTYEFATVNGQLGLVVSVEHSGRPARVLGFAVRDGLVWGTYDLTNPAKLTGIHLG